MSLAYHETPHSKGGDASIKEERCDLWLGSAKYRFIMNHEYFDMAEYNKIMRITGHKNIGIIFLYKEEQ